VTITAIIARFGAIVVQTILAQFTAATRKGFRHFFF
jgi:hypothetical protein